PKHRLEPPLYAAPVSVCLARPRRPTSSTLSSLKVSAFSMTFWMVAFSTSAPAATPASSQRRRHGWPNGLPNVLCLTNSESESGFAAPQFSNLRNRSILLLRSVTSLRVGEPAALPVIHACQSLPLLD